MRVDQFAGVTIQIFDEAPEGYQGVQAGPHYEWEGDKFVMYDWVRKDMPSVLDVIDPEQLHVHINQINRVIKAKDSMDVGQKSMLGEQNVVHLFNNERVDEVNYDMESLIIILRS